MKTLVKSNGNLPETTSMFDDFFMRDFFNVPSLGRSNMQNVPAVNIKETDKSYEIEVAAPGMKKEDFKIEVDRQLLIVSAEKRSEKEEKEDNYSRREFSYSTFKRSFTLPERMVDAEKIDAEYKDGVLHLFIPKLKEAIKSSRVIQIK
jgi:HSP20 family protein